MDKFRDLVFQAWRVIFVGVPVLIISFGLVWFGLMIVVEQIFPGTADHLNQVIEGDK